MLSDFYGDYSKTLAAAKQEMEGQKIKLKEDETDFVCELCGRKMVVKTGRFGKFIACPGYPECKNIKKFEKGTGVTCPKCGGEIIEKKSKKGRIFYGCNKYPACDFSSWTQPSKEKCPQCGGILFVKKGKKPSLVCQTEGCGFIKQE
ncbi:MAG: topoisomerase DNA-binding C4 zinc finger domain-containing protein [Oscillospiraceae bacterium]|nr:topoisomerase DNA-binding C4 zinc finger domain-containing protein [Oscillospiraceae bacterium]